VRPTVVYVHENGNRVRKGLLKAEWDIALFGEDTGPASRMAYWASLRYAGVTEVQDLVVQALRAPGGVTAWRNVADGRDLVALDRTIRPEYTPEQRCTDFLVVNDSPNRHGIRQYLSCPPVRAAVTVLVT
jgi:hypothetical protein